MADLKTLYDELRNLKKQIEKIFSMSKYQDYDELAGLDDYQQIKTADQRQQLEECRIMLLDLEEIENILAYYERPIREVSRIYRNETGRYETNSGYYYTSGSRIEFLRSEEVYDYDTNTWENAEIWTRSWVESKDGEYFIVHYPDVQLSGLTVRVRG